MKKVWIAGAVIVVILFFNYGCTCDAWFNNGGCKWSETWIGSKF